jgi:hypothetical protein
MRIYTTDEMNTAIKCVDDAKAMYPVGWAFLDVIGLRPSDSYVTYAFLNAEAHLSRLEEESDLAVVYAVGWLNGLSVGACLAQT